jgi:N-acetylmuramoyl-L-alanine amidase
MIFERPMQTMSKLASVLLVVAAFAGPGAEPASAQSARSLYTRAMGRERAVRDADRDPSLRELRATIAGYESLVRRYPASAYCDNALWQAANLALLAFERFADPVDQRTGLRLLAHLKREYSSSSLVARADVVGRQFAEVAPLQHAPRPMTVKGVATVGALHASSSPATPAAGSVSIREIRRTPLPDGVRVTIEMDGESLFRQGELDNPRRLFFDLKDTRASGALQDATIKFTDGAVRQIRLGRRPQGATRVVLELEGTEAFSVFTLYNPFRLIIDLKGPSVSVATTAGTTGTTATPALPPPPPPVREVVPDEKPVVPDVTPLAARTATVPVPPIPTAPALNLNGQFSLARQLGLGVSRIVIDAGHGGHDPGARANGLNEAELVLDVASRLRKLLEKQPTIEVAMTRETDVYVPLEQRTAIANREQADLFLSIHANASRSARARGVETYFLNFASNPEAEAVAARENSTSGRSMRSLPEIVRAIALNNKIDESRDFADTVQKSMVRRLAARNGQLRNLGVKQAPFVVLIGAGMPSVLAEISFLTNRQEAQLLKTGAYRQQIAEALYDAILRYQGSLKKVRAIAARE